MSALQVLIDGFVRAAEMLALLIVLPATAAALPVPIEGHDAQAPRVQSTLGVRRLGTLAVRTRERIRNDGPTPIDLALHLPAVDARTEALRIHRRGRMIDLLHVGDCGGDDTDGSGEHVAGHAQLAVDEAIADALQLAPGETALIETLATRPLVNAGAFFRLAVPLHAASESQAWLVDQADVAFVVVIVAGNASGTARVTLRPTSGAAETIELGELNAVPAAFVIPLADRAALVGLAVGAIELEAQSKDYVMWSTIPAQLRSGTSLAVVQVPELGSAR